MQSGEKIDEKNVFFSFLFVGYASLSFVYCGLLLLVVLSVCVVFSVSSSALVFRLRNVQFVNLHLHMRYEFNLAVCFI